MQPEAFPEFDGIRIVRHAFVPRNYFWRTSEYLREFRLRPALMESARSLMADVIYVHGEGLARCAADVARQLGISVVACLHGVPLMPRYMSIPGRRNRFADALRRADRLVLVGEPLRAYFGGIVGRVDHMRVVHNGVTPPSTETRSPFSESALRFVSVSNLQEGKGIDIALRGLKLAAERGLDDWSYTVVGGGVEQYRLMKLASLLQLRDRVNFLGARPHCEVYGHLEHADVFLLPSYREAFGIAYLEAMAAGLLAVGVKGQGPEAFIENGKTGILVDPQDPRALAESILRVAANRKEMAAIARAGAEVARARFSWESHARALSAVFDEAIGQRAQ